MANNEELTAENKEYLALQKKWVESSKLKEGDAVTVLNKATSNQSGWPDEWFEQMDEFVGQTGKCLYPDDVLGVLVEFPDGTATALPFFILARAGE